MPRDLPAALDRFAGGPDALATLISGIAAVPVAGVSTLARSVPAYFKKDKSFDANKEMRESMDNMTWTPKTKSGAAMMEGLAHAIDVLKIPPYAPGVGAVRAPLPGSGRYAAEAAGRAVGPAIENALQKQGLILNAVKQPGGHWTPQSQWAMAESLLRGAADDAPHIKEWGDKAIPRYLNKLAGTDKDPAKGLKLGPEMTYEQVMDKSLKGTPSQNINPLQRPPMARDGELVWNYEPKPELARFMDHAGDFLANIAPEDLARMDVPTLLKQVAKADAMGGKALAKKASTREAAALELTNAHPAKDIAFESDVGKWLRFTKGQDPEYVKRGLSVDTCIGDHCVASIGHGRPNLGYPGHVPVRDLVTGKNPLVRDGLHGVLDRGGGAGIRDTTGYIENVLSGKGDIYSLRTPEGIPAATMETVMPANQGVPRSFVRDSLMNKSRYLQWQKAQKLAGVPLEQDAPPLPGGGKISPPRGLLQADQLESIVAQFPEYQAALAEYIKNPPHDVRQFKGMQNRAVSPRFNQMSTDMLRQQMAANRLTVKPNNYDLQRSGILSKGRGLESLDEILAKFTPEELAGPNVRDIPRLKGLTQLTPNDSAILTELMMTLGRNR